MPPPITAGLSDLTKKFSTGDPSSYATRYLDDSTPEAKYESYTKLLAGNSWFKYPPDSPEYKMIFVSRDYHFNLIRPNTITNRPTSTTVNGYVLPLPQTALIDKYDVSYDDNAAFLSALRGMLPTPRILDRAITNAETVGKFLGLNLNKFKTVLLEAPVLKRHTFVWKLSPKNRAESTIIRNIVNNLKADSSPRLDYQNLAFAFPNIFDIYFEPNAQWFYGFKPSVIESISVDYNSDNPHPALYFDTGAPESITLTLSFIETELWVQEDYHNWNRAINDGVLHPTETLRRWPLTKHNGPNDPPPGFIDPVVPPFVP